MPPRKRPPRARENSDQLYTLDKAGARHAAKPSKEARAHSELMELAHQRIERQIDEEARRHFAREKGRERADKLIAEGKEAAALSSGMFDDHVTMLVALDDNTEEDIGPEGIFPLTGVTHIIGESNVGKSPFSYWCLLHRIREGQQVGVYDKEMNQPRIWKRLVELGAEPEEREQFHYLGDFGRRSDDILPYADELAYKIQELGIQTFLFDSLTSLLQAAGIDENSPNVRKFTDRVFGTIAALGCSVFVIDHLGAFDKSRGRGSSDKKAGCDFAFTMTAKKAASRGVDGDYVLKCIKDRSATVVGQTMGVHVATQDDGSFTYEPTGWVTAEEAGMLNEINDAPPNTSGRKSTTQDAMAAVLTRPMTAAQISEATGIELPRVKSALTRGKDIRFTSLGNGKWERK